MKRQLTFIFLALAVLLVPGSVHGEAPAEPNPTARLEIRVYEVFGMDCPGCHGSIEKLVNKIEGVASSEANWNKKQIVVRVKKGATVTDEAIFDAIKRANFTPGERLK